MQILAVGAKHLRLDLSVKSGFLSANASPSTYEIYEIMRSRERALVAWKGEAFGTKNPGFCLLAIAQMLRPYSTRRKMFNR